MCVVDWMDTLVWLWTYTWITKKDMNLKLNFSTCREKLCERITSNQSFVDSHREQWPKMWIKCVVLIGMFGLCHAGVMDQLLLEWSKNILREWNE